MTKIKSLLLVTAFSTLFASCSNSVDGEIATVDSSRAVISASSKSSKVNYRQKMRDFVIKISKTAKAKNSKFVVIPQNGQEVAWDNDDAVWEKKPNAEYLAAIDGIGREDLFYGFEDDDVATNADDVEYLTDLCNFYKNAGKTVLVTDYCWTKDYIKKSYANNKSAGFISYAAPDRDLNVVPKTSSYFPRNANTKNIKKLSDAKNFLYLINPEFESAEEFVSELSKTNYDILLIDLFFDGEPLQKEQIKLLKKKANGASRLVICYMSIGEAEDYRWYWDENASWVSDENPDWEGNFKVKYWDKNWQNIIVSGKDSYLSKILDAGFDGVYLDIIDAYEHFE